MIVESSYTESPRGSDGKRLVSERHVGDDGRVYTYYWTGDQDADLVLIERRSRLNARLKARAQAAAVVQGTELPMTKLKFRELFTLQERMGIDALHAGFEAHPDLTAEQKNLIRTGLEDYRVAENIARPFDERVTMMLDLYTAIGLLTQERRDEIASAGNG